MAQPYKGIDDMAKQKWVQGPMGTGIMVDYKDGDAILVDEPLPRRLYDKIPCVLCGRLKPQDEWCSRCGENEYTAAMLSMRDDRHAEQPNFIIVPWSDQEICESLIREDNWSAAYFGMAMMIVWGVCMALWSILTQEQWPNG